MSYEKIKRGHPAYDRVKALRKSGANVCDSLDHNEPEGCSNPACGNRKMTKAESAEAQRRGAGAAEKLRTRLRARKDPTPASGTRVLAEKPSLSACPDCAAAAGQPHDRNCDVQRCSVCGGQRLQCNCRGHDAAFARWSGFFPGSLEAKELGMSLNDFYASGMMNTLSIKPKGKA